MFRSALRYVLFGLVLLIATPAHAFGPNYCGDGGPWWFALDCFSDRVTVTLARQADHVIYKRVTLKFGTRSYTRTLTAPAGAVYSADYVRNGSTTFTNIIGWSGHGKGTVSVYRCKLDPIRWTCGWVTETFTD